jgi:hypothetical protein
MNQDPVRRAHALRAGALALGAFASFSGPAHGQAWLPSEGSAGFALDYSDMLNKKHYTSTGDEVDVGHTDTQVLSFSGSYSPSDRWALSASLPLVRTRHRGPGLGGHDTAIDDGTWHSTVTDLQLLVSYQALGGPVGLAPYAGLVIPTHDYETFGHSAPGRGLNELWLGFFAGTSLHEWIPRTYVQLRGNYAFVEEVADVAHDRTNATLELGFFVNRSISVRALVSSQWTHGGIDVPVPTTDPLFPYHDQLAAEEFVNIGAGGTWAINPRVSAYGMYMQAVEGTNAHKLDHRVSIGVSYGVGAH